VNNKELKILFKNRKICIYSCRLIPFLCVIVFSLSRLMSPLSKDETRRDSSFTFLICPYTVIKACLCIFVYSCLGREDGCRCDRNT